MKKLKIVDAYVLKHMKWSAPLELLRETMNLVGLEENYKWNTPVYVHKKKNVVGVGAFKNHFGIWFFNGSLLMDLNKNLQSSQESKKIAMRQWRFYSMDELIMNMAEVEAYLLESFENADLNKVIQPCMTRPVIVPLELANELAKGLHRAFQELSLTKKREFVAYIDSAKREVTKQDRIKRIIPMIREGRGLYDKYKK